MLLAGLGKGLMFNSKISFLPDYIGGTGLGDPAVYGRLDPKLQIAVSQFAFVLSQSEL